MDYLQRKKLECLIKPDSLFLCDNGVVKLGGFGMMSLLYHSFPTWNISYYRSSDVVELTKELKNDVWSLGMTMLEMVEGVNPLFNDGMLTIDCVRKRFQPDFSEGKWSEESKSFVEKCLVSNMEQRSSVSELMEHPFVRESVERIRRDGYSEVLAQLANAFKSQQRFKKCLKETNKSQFLIVHHHEGSCWYYEGVMELPSTVISTTKGYCVEVDVKRKELLQVNGEEVTGIEHAQVLDLSDDGERWEGDVLDNQPYGWGVLYDSENRLVFEGFRIGDVNVCYGRSYYSDTGVIEYEGGIYEGKRWGRGTQYDRTGVVIYEGGWLNNTHEDGKIILINKDNYRSVLYHTMVEELIVGDYCCNGEEWRMIDYSLLRMLRELRVGNGSFKRVNKVSLVSLHQLERVVIGKDCFTEKEDECEIFNREYRGRFYMKDCEKVRELKIGYHSFCDYERYVIENTPLLEAIEMGNAERSDNFIFASTFELKNLSKLRSLSFGGSAFGRCSHVVLENLPELESIQLGNHALRFNQNASSDLIMRNLPRLSTLTTEEESASFCLPHHAILEDMPSLTRVSLPEAFIDRHDLQYKNVGELIKHEHLHPSNPEASIHSSIEWSNCSGTFDSIIVDNNACNDTDFVLLDLTRFASLKVFEVGYYSFSYVKEVKLIRLSQLERVVIGMGSFTKHKSNCRYSASRHFYLKNCERLRELKMGRHSFADYSVCEIENVPSLEVIEMGELDEESYNFWFASLELKNMPSLKSLLFGDKAFEECSRAVFENLPELTSIEIGDRAFGLHTDEKVTEFTMRNLPKLATLRISKANYGVSKWPHRITLENIPSLKNSVLPMMFFNSSYVFISNVGVSIQQNEVTNPSNPNVHSIEEFNALNRPIESLVVASG
ncbi:hypothetical protein WA556_000175, partial [Blastocystis sp. ATCC 50177/Nand II]